MKQALAVLPEPLPPPPPSLVMPARVRRSQPRNLLTYVNKEQASKAPYAKKDGGPIEAA
jgi:hypothetical protein